MKKEHRQLVIVKALVEDKGKILFIRRERPEDKKTHNKWEMPGGKLEFKEGISECAVREAKEETGYDIEFVEFVPHIETFVTNYPEWTSHLIFVCCVCRLKGGYKILDDHGVNRIEWVSAEEAMKLDVQPKTLEFIEEYLKRAGLTKNFKTQTPE